MSPEAVNIAIAVAGAVAAVALQTWLIIKYLIGRMDKGDAELHGRIDQVKDDYVRRDDFNMHLQRVEQGIDKAVSRLDRIVEIIHARAGAVGE